jgi:hypothetical protein
MENQLAKRLFGPTAGLDVVKSGLTVNQTPVLLETVYECVVCIGLSSITCLRYVLSFKKPKNFSTISVTWLFRPTYLSKKLHQLQHKFRGTGNVPMHAMKTYGGVNKISSTHS